MLHLSNQTAALVLPYFVNYPSLGVTATSAGIFRMCLVFVSDSVPFPETHADSISYINSALNGSPFYGGTAGNENNCLGIVDTLAGASVVGNTATFDGPSFFTAKQTGKIGGAILLPLFGSSTSYPNTLYPMTPATVSTSANSLTGGTTTTQAKMYNYMMMTNNIGSDFSKTVAVETLDLIRGQTYGFYGASITVKSGEK